MPIIHARVDQTREGILFLHIPKTGGTSIEHEFRQMGMMSYEDSSLYTPWGHFLRNSREKRIRYSLQHVTFEEGIRMTSLMNIHIGGVFTIVRNPYDRLRSEYYYMKNRLLVKDRDCSIWGITPSWRTDALKTFDSFVRAMYEEYKTDPHTMDNHFLPQVEFLRGITSHPLIQHTKIYYFDDEIRRGEIMASLRRDFGDILHWAQDRPAGLPLVHKNKFTPKSSPPPPMEASTLRIIQEWYYKDFLFFGFPLDDKSNGSTGVGPTVMMGDDKGAMETGVAETGTGE